MSHTPGPWTPDEYGGYVFGPSNEMVAQIRGYGAGLPQTENIRLIAAAPELLKELKHLVALLEPVEDTLNVPGLATLNGARVAIAKAEAE